MIREVSVAQRVALLSIVCLAAFGCATSAGNPGLPSPSAEYRIAPPDLLEITVRPEPEIEREVTVRPDGRISFDLIGDVEASGRTIEDIPGVPTCQDEAWTSPSSPELPRGAQRAP